MKMQDINKKFNEVVRDYMMDGYEISALSMKGGQGELGKVDLVKGDELLRVYINNSYELSDARETRYYGDKIVLRVGRWSRPAKDTYEGYTVWLDELETVSETYFYRVGFRGSYDRAWWTEDLSHAIKCQDLRFKRSANDTPNYNQKYYYDERRQAIASKYMKRRQGYKRVASQNITVIKSEHRGYFVHYNENNWRLH